MKKVSEIYKPIKDPVCLTFGVYDGVHRGHEIIINKVKEVARRKKCKSCILTFYPHPQKVLKKDFKGLLFPFYYRLQILKDFKFNYCILLGFNKRMSKLKAGDFFKKLQQIVANIKVVIIGEDFRMGSDRLDAAQLKDSVNLPAAEFIVVKDVYSHGKRISSTLIKEAVKKGDFKKAEKLLGREYFIIGPVVKGRRIGRKIGFPTANIDTKDLIVPREGVYTCQVVLKKKNLPALLSIGRHPTFEKTKKIISEVYIPHFKGDLYTEVIKVRPVKYIRAQKRFSSPEKLTSQIKKDLRHL